MVCPQTSGTMLIQDSFEGESFHLVLLDFSGTLSVGAIRFGVPENLERALRESGLKRLGVRNAGDFWNRCINPFWKRGSTSDAGYGALLAEVLEKEYRAFPEDARKGAQCFRDLYFEASRIHLLWKPLLIYLLNRRNVIGVITTDHYAEIAAHLERQLREMGLRGYPLKKGPPLSEGFLEIASSADLGFTKDQEGFWKTLRENLPFSFRSIFLVEDFGANEPAGDIYGNFRRVLERRRQTTEHLQNAFFRSPVICDCALAAPYEKDTTEFFREYEIRVRDITKKIKEALE